MQIVEKSYNYIKDIVAKKFSDPYELTAVSIPIVDNTGYSYSKYMKFHDGKGKGKGELKNWKLSKFTKKDNNIFSMQMQRKMVKVLQHR